MEIKLAYGKSGLMVNLPDNWDIEILEPRFVQGLKDEKNALVKALENPNGKPARARYVQSTDRVGIIFNDITRATPNRVIVPAILEQIQHVPAENITLFDALGTHRRNTETELCDMLGDELVAKYHIVQNNAFDPATQINIGKTRRGNEIWLNRTLVECDVIILTGFIEPHLFAGYSGGGKAVMPGMAGLQTVMNNHTPQAVSHPKAIWGVTEGNPIFEEIQEIALHLPRTFLVNVTLNKHQEITGVFTGEVKLAHEAGCEFVRSTAMVGVDQPFDIVVTTNSGYPLDQNLYQSVKGMSAAAQIVRKGGTILSASECSDGIPNHGKFAELLVQCGSPQGWLEMASQPGFQVHDQWEVQVQTNICLQADVYLYSHYLSDEQIRAAWLKPSRDIRATIEMLRKRFPVPRIAIMPEGPQTVPYIRE